MRTKGAALATASNWCVFRTIYGRAKALFTYVGAHAGYPTIS